MIRAFLTTILLLGTVQAMAASTAETPHFTAQLIAESRAPAPGEHLTLALVIKPETGWHTYWKNPGETGLPPQPEWTLPPGFTAGELQHPVPSELVVGGITSNVHEHTVALLTDLSVPKTLQSGSAIPIGLDVNVLICSEGECIPEEVSLDLSLAAGNGTPDSEQASLFKDARAALPVPLVAPARYEINEKTLKLFLPLPPSDDIVSAHVFFDGDGIVAHGQQAAVKNDGGLSIVMPRGDIPANATLNGVVRIVHSARSASQDTVRGYRFVARPGAVSASSGLGISFFLALGGAILGGLLLNLMPCIFPILSIKVLALVRAGGDEREARVEAIGYALGAMTVLVALGAAVIEVKKAGYTAGWAFQLQDTRVVAMLLLLVTAIATNLAGLYELPSINLKVGPRKGFWGGIATGSLAAFIATPCTGPFMAGALGAALLLPAPAALAVFAGLGFGLSLPFLCLGYIAPLRRWLPRPGAWMLTLRRLLSLPMFATALGLTWIVGREAGISAMTVSLAASLLLGVALWWYGLRQVSGRVRLPAFFPIAAAVVLAFAGLQPLSTRSATSETDAHLLSSKPYSASLLKRLRDNHQPVFIYLTADWCLSCKVNEATSLSSETVAKAFSRAHVTVLEGDWTRGDPEVSQLLAKQGRLGVPLYLWYSGNGPPRELPQVLTPSMLLKLSSSVGKRHHTS